MNTYNNMNSLESINFSHLRKQVFDKKTRKVERKLEALMKTRPLPDGIEDYVHKLEKYLEKLSVRYELAELDLMSLRTLLSKIELRKAVLRGMLENGCCTTNAQFYQEELDTLEKCTPILQNWSKTLEADIERYDRNNNAILTTCDLLLNDPALIQENSEPRQSRQETGAQL